MIDFKVEITGYVLASFAIRFLAQFPSSTKVFTAVKFLLLSIRPQLFESREGQGNLGYKKKHSWFSESRYGEPLQTRKRHPTSTFSITMRLLLIPLCYTWGSRSSTISATDKWNYLLFHPKTTQEKGLKGCLSFFYRFFLKTEYR